MATIAKERPLRQRLRVAERIDLLGAVLNKELLNAREGPHRDVWIAIVVVRSLGSLATAALLYCLYRYYQADFQFLQLVSWPAHRQLAALYA